MALLNILQYPDERLKTIAQPVATIDERVKQIVADMAQTMYQAKGIGLAATQVDIHERIVVIDVSEEQNQLLVLINPTITQQNGEVQSQEGCLSIPSIYDKVTRAQTVTVEFLDLNGQAQKMDADGLLAICIQHELDHLAGKLFVEYLSPLKQNRIKTKLKKQQKQQNMA